VQKLTITAALLMALAVTGCVNAPPSAAPEEAATSYPWCASYPMDLGTNCGFVSLEQCRASITSLGGQCYPNGLHRGGGRPEKPDAD
jgi:hypothetical protein